jgi:hypothetical protein
LRDQHPELRVARPSLERWPVQHDWAARSESARRRRCRQRCDCPTDEIGRERPNRRAAKAGQPDALARAQRHACRYLPNEVKSLIDSAANAIKLAEQIEASQTGKSTAADVGEAMQRR